MYRRSLCEKTISRVTCKVPSPTVQRSICMGGRGSHTHASKANLSDIDKYWRANASESFLEPPEARDSYVEGNIWRRVGEVGYEGSIYHHASKVR